ncbi:hypothetical protein [Ferrovum sp.]|uniref:hypothetical protein n=1 Tax=Ferrovum sp. TaxID=2609467 RepID=UPI00260B4201|nr:hypothetical protein [Ferrovum sp.]
MVNESTYFTPLPTVETVMRLYGFDRFQAQVFISNLRVHRLEFMEKKEREKKRWLFALLMMLCVLRQRQNLDLDNSLINGLAKTLSDFISTLKIEEPDQDSDSKPKPKPKL